MFRNLIIDPSSIANYKWNFLKFWEAETTMEIK